MSVCSSAERSLVVRAGLEPAWELFYRLGDQQVPPLCDLIYGFWIYSLENRQRLTNFAILPIIKMVHPLLPT